MRGIFALALLAVVLITGIVVGSAQAQTPPQGEAAKRFLGAWRYVSTTVDDKPRSGRGAEPKGILYYDPSGFMASQIAPDKPRPMAGKMPTAEEAKEAAADYVAVLGTYTIDERAGTVTHHLQANVQPGPNGDSVRLYEFRGDRLILRPPGTTMEVTWERFK
jgi:hypothetical protein